MSNQPITDMIETIERYAQLQPDYPVYNVLGEEHTYGQLKADSDSLAAHIDQMGLPEKSPVVVFGGQEYEMLATFVALTNLAMPISQLIATLPWSACLPLLK